MPGFSGGSDKFRTERGVTVEVKPFTDQDDITFVFLDIQDHIGTQPAHGEIRLRYIKRETEDLYRETNVVNLIIEQEDPHDKYDINGWINQKIWNHELGILTLRFVCVPLSTQGQFAYRTRVRKFEKYKIKDLIQEVWGDVGVPRFRWRTVPEPDIPIDDYFQDRFTDWQFLNKLCFSVRKNTLYSFDFEGLIVKDIKDWEDRIWGFPEPYRIAVALDDHTAIDSGNVVHNYESRLYKKIENPAFNNEEWLQPPAPGDELSKNFRSEILDDEFRIYRRQDNYPRLEKCQDNYRYNNRLVSSCFLSSIALRYTDNLPPLRVLDVIKYAKAPEEVEPVTSTYVVTDVRIFISGDKDHLDEYKLKFSSTCIIRGLKDIRGTLLPDGSNDPIDQK